MSKQIYELKHTRAGLIADAEKAITNKDQTGYEAKMAEVKKLNDEIGALEAIEVEKGRFSDEDTDKVSLANAIQNKKEDEKKERSLNDIRATNEYRRAFCASIRNKVSPKTAFGEEYNPLRAALKEAGGTPEGADGGFLVPIDIDNNIREQRKNMVSLIDLVQVENVMAPTGWRVKDTAPSKGFTKLSGELTAIPEDDQPKFAKVDYSLDTYGLFIPMSKELIDDEDANLLNYLSRWFGKKAIITENLIILALLAKITGTDATAGNEVNALKTALNETLDPDIAMNAKWLTNQGGFNTLDKLVDGNKRPLMQPDVVQLTQQLMFGYPITKVSNSQLAAAAEKDPVYVGDFEQYLTVFRRQALEVATTDIGGNAWRNYGYEMRGIMRLDAAVFDDKAVTKVNLPKAVGGA